MNKYELTGETTEFMGKILYRIIACKTFEDGLNHMITYHKMATLGLPATLGFPATLRFPAVPGFPTTLNLIK